MPLLGGGHRLVLRCWGLSCLNWRRKYHAIRVTARSLAVEVQGLEPTVGRLGPMVATESSVPPVFPTDGRMTLVSSWTTLCRGEFGSRHGTKKDATFSRGTQAPLSFEFGLPEGQTPRDECRRPPFWGQKQHVFPCYYIELSVSRARRRLKCRKLTPGPPSPAGEGPDSGRKVLTKRLLPKSTQYTC